MARTGRNRQAMSGSPLYRARPVAVKAAMRGVREHDTGPITRIRERHALKTDRLFCLQAHIVGVYWHCGQSHLHRCLADFDFSYNRRAALKISDAERAKDILRQARDKRLTYRRIGEAAYA
jgi:hypothetical protein